MNRNLTNQDISWFLDLHEKQQLNLDPPYQRRSVWSPRDRRFFVDTILNNYPAPPVFLHKTMDQLGRSTYHVVDGKQRLQTIIDFVNDRFRIPDDFADINLQRKKWTDLPRETKLAFWNYSLIVEMLPDVSEAMIRSIFERINRNSRRLTSQELRHAKYEGWFISFVETEAARAEWVNFGVVTASRAKRMADVQFISELCAAILTQRVLGFSQNFLDDLYAEYEDTSELGDFQEDAFLLSVEHCKHRISDLIGRAPDILQHLRTQSHFYSLWTYTHFTQRDWDDDSSRTYATFLQAVQDLLAAGPAAADLEVLRLQGVDPQVFDYAMNTRGANTDETPRLARHNALLATLGQ